jgi:hypothetical protein
MNQDDHPPAPSDYFDPLSFLQNHCSTILPINLLMKILPFVFSVALLCLSLNNSPAATLNPLKELTVSQIVGQAEWAPLKTETMQPLTLGQTITENIYITTGKGARVELTAADQTTVRIGSQALFRIGSAFREFNLEVGTLLLQAPKDFGGGKIQTPQGSAAARGTTFMVTTNKEGAFKASCLESNIEIKLRTGQNLILKAGQASYMLPGSRLSAPINFDVANTVKTSTMVTGFEKPLASMPLIQKVVQNQERQIAQGQLRRTDRASLEPPAPLGEGGQSTDRPAGRLANANRLNDKPPTRLADSNRSLSKAPTMLRGSNNRPMVLPPARPNRAEIASANNPSTPQGASGSLSPLKIQKERRAQAVRLLREREQALTPLAPPLPP